MRIISLISVVVFLFLNFGSQKIEKAPLLKGTDFAADFASLPYLKTGTQTYQNSSTDPAEDQFNDHSNWLYTENDSNAVLADIDGPGCLYRIWSTGNSGDSNFIKIYIDGETTPRIYQTFNSFHNFPPLRQKPQVGSGGDHYLAWWSYMPIPFKKSCRVVREGNLRPFYSITYHTYSDTTGVKSWTGHENPGKMENMWNHPDVDPKPKTGNIKTTQRIKLSSGEVKTIYLKKGAGSIASIKISNYIPDKGMRLKIYWDGEAKPSVDAPVKWFFGSVDNGGDLKALGIGTTANAGYCYFPMPFWQEAKLVLENKTGKNSEDMVIEVQYNPSVYEKSACGYFHAVASEEEKPDKKYTCLKTNGAGHIVGMAKRMPKGGHACEGDEVFYIDNRHYPDLYGTGEEDYNNNAWWTNSYNSFPTHGCVGNDCYYRLHYPDVIAFTEAIDMEFETWESYYICSVVWFYKNEKPSVILSDSLDIGNNLSETAHKYSVKGKIRSEKKTGTYPGKQIYTGSLTDEGVTFTGASEFTVKIKPDNKGVRLRLRTDNGAMQVARVWVDNTEVKERHWKISRNRFLATWVDADFEIPQSYTNGKSNLLIKIEYSSDSRKAAWTEYNYEVFSYLR